MRTKTMNRSLLALILILGVAAGCKKNEESVCPQVTITAPAAEVDSLKAYLDSNDITAVKDPRGFYYTIDSAGTGAKPTACSPVSVDYVGKLTNGTVFDTGTNASFYISDLIIGWQEAIPLIATGGKITLYLPPSLGYGSTASADGSIPANSNLIFNIRLNHIY